MMAPCSWDVSLLNEPVRRSGYQIPHGHSGLSAARRGRRSSQSSRSVSKPEAYVRPNIVSSGFCASPANGSALSTSRRAVTKKSGSSLIASTPTPRESLTSWYSTASSRLDSSARSSGLASRHPPNTESCMKSRRSEVCRSAPRSWTSIFVVSEALTLSPPCTVARRPAGPQPATACGEHDLTALPAPGVHLQVRVFAEASDLHEWRAIPKPQPLLGSAVRTPPPRAGDQRLQLVRRRSAAKRLPEVDAVLGVETQVPHAVGREPATIAARAERLGR